MAFYFLPVIWIAIILLVRLAKGFDDKNQNAIMAAAWAVAVFFGSYFLPCLLWATKFCRHPSVVSAAAAAVIQACVAYFYLRLSIAFAASKSTVIVYQAAAGFALFYVLLVFFSYFPYL